MLPRYPFGSEASNTAEFSAEWMVSNEKQAVQKLSGAVHSSLAFEISPGYCLEIPLTLTLCDMSLMSPTTLIPRSLGSAFFCVVAALIVAVAPSLAAESAQEGMKGTGGEERQKEHSTASPQPQTTGFESLEAFLKRGEYTFIPLPAFSYTRNESYWIGAVMPILKEDQAGNISTLIHPQYFYNRWVGQTVTGSYLHYPSHTAHYEIAGAVSEKKAREIALRYKDLGAGGGRYILGAQFDWLINPFARFFGFGNLASEQRETNYTSREALVKFTAGINLTPDVAVLVTERYRDVRVGDAFIEGVPSTKQQVPSLAGIGGAQVIGHQLTVFYDTRDHQRTPTKGMYVLVSGEYNQDLQHDEANRWWRYTFEARTLIPHANDRLILVPHVLVDSVIGDRLETTSVAQAKSERRGIPFFERPMLGGENTLRAFGQNRFISNTAILFNVEERLLVKELVLFGYSIGLEVAPFIDLGRVQRQSPWHKLNLKNWQVNPGVGFRLLVHPHIVARADFAYGRDGSNTFIGLDYPF